MYWDWPCIQITVLRSASHGITIQHFAIILQYSLSVRTSHAVSKLVNITNIHEIFILNSRLVHEQGRSLRFARRGWGIFAPPPCRNFSPPKLILCEIYPLISSFGLQKSYHTTPKTRDIKGHGGGVCLHLKLLGGRVLPPHATPLFMKHSLITSNKCILTALTYVSCKIVGFLLL